MQVLQLQETFCHNSDLSQICIRFRRIILLVQTKNMISMNYGSSTSSWKPWRWVMLGLILQWGIYTSIPTWTHSQNSLAAAEELSLKISSHGTSPKWSKRPSKPARNSHKLCDEMGRPILILVGRQWIVEQILASEERKKSKRASLWEPQSGNRLGMLTI